MFPEQKESAQNVTAQSDLYSVGMLMYNLFIGKLPSGRHPDPGELNPEVSDELNQWILQCLQEDPNHRPDSAEELKTRLLEISRGAHSNEEQKLGAE